jgi:hypothetical protein
MMKRLSDDDGLRWSGGEVSSPVRDHPRPRVGKAVLAAYAVGFTLMVVAAADSVAQNWGR